MKTPKEIVLEVLDDALPGWDGDYPVFYDDLADRIVNALDDAQETPRPTHGALSQGGSA